MKLKLDGKELIQRVTLEIDMRPVYREAFGVFRWRLKLSKLLLRMAVRVLRCGVHITDWDE